MIAKVHDWLEGQGYPLEMRVAAAFRQAGFDVRQSDYYTDDESGKAREIDVIANARSDIGYIDVNFIVECKSSKKPWVLLTSPDTLSGANRIFLFSVSSRMARELLADRYKEFKNRIPWLGKSNRCGYSLRQAFSDGKDQAFSATISAAKAAEHAATSLERWNSATFRFAFPVIVVDTPIVECTLGDDGSLESCEIPQGELLLSTKFSSSFFSCLRIVNVEHIKDFVYEAKRVSDAIISEYAAPEQDLLKDAQTAPRGDGGTKPGTDQGV